MTKWHGPTIIYYCPQCQKGRPERPMNQDPLNQKVSVPKICPTHEAMNSKLIAEIKAAKEVKMCDPGESGRDKKAHKECLFNRKKRPKADRSKSQPP
jgi:hypothetical protein